MVITDSFLILLLINLKSEITKRKNLMTNAPVVAVEASEAPVEDNIVLILKMTELLKLNVY